MKIGDKVFVNNSFICFIVGIGGIRKGGKFERVFLVEAGNTIFAVKPSVVSLAKNM